MCLRSTRCRSTLRLAWWTPVPGGRNPSSNDRLVAHRGVPVTGGCHDQLHQMAPAEIWKFSMVMPNARLRHRNTSNSAISSGASQRPRGMLSSIVFVENRLEIPAASTIRSNEQRSRGSIDQAQAHRIAGHTIGRKTSLSTRRRIRRNSSFVSLRPVQSPSSPGKNGHAAKRPISATDPTMSAPRL